MLSMNHEL